MGSRRSAPRATMSTRSPTTELPTTTSSCETRKTWTSARRSSPRRSRRRRLRGARTEDEDALESRFFSELALFEEMGDIAAELDAMQFARDAFDAEQAASRFAAVAESRRVELLGARRNIEQRDATREYEALTARDGRDADAAAFTEQDIARVAETIAEKMREESLAHLRGHRRVPRGRRARAGGRGRRRGGGAQSTSGVDAEGAAEGPAEGPAEGDWRPRRKGTASGVVALEVPFPTLPHETSTAGDRGVDAESETVESEIVDEIGGVVPDACVVAWRFVPRRAACFRTTRRTPSARWTPSTTKCRGGSATRSAS